MKSKKNIIKLFLMVYILFVFSFTSEAASTIKEGNLEYSISNGKATLIKYYAGETVVTVPSSVQGYPVVAIGDYAFRASGVQRVVISEGIEVIGEGAFYVCENLESVSLPSTVKTIDAMAFANNFLLNNVTLPRALTNLDNTAFANCTRLNNLYVNGDNPNFSAQDGVLFNKNKTTLILCPNVSGRTSYSVPNSVTRIGEYAFYGCSYLKSVAFPASLTSIGDNAFYGCSNLNTVAMGENVSSIGTNAIPYRQIKSVRFYTKASKNKHVGYFTNASEIVCLCRASHSYDNDSDTSCNVCEYTRTISPSTPSNPSTPPSPGGSTVPSSITSSVYKVSGGYISKIPFGKTVQELINGINEKQYIRVYSGASQVSGSAKAGTGMSVRLMDGSTMKASVLAVVTGDTNGDGNVTITDMLAIKSHLLKKSSLTGAPAKAADTSGDNAISITDFIQVKAYILKKGTIQAR